MMREYLIHAALAAVWCAEVFAFTYGTDFRGETDTVLMTVALFGFLPGLAAASLVKSTGYKGTVVLLALANLGFGAYLVAHYSQMKAEVRRDMTNSASHLIGETGGRAKNALFQKRYIEPQIGGKKLAPEEEERLKDAEQKAERMAKEAKEAVPAVLDEPVGIDVRIDKLATSAEGLFALVTDDKAAQGRAREALRGQLAEALVTYDKTFRAAEFGVRCGYGMLAAGTVLALVALAVVLRWKSRLSTTPER